MKSLLIVWLLVALVAFVASHVVLLVSLGRARGTEGHVKRVLLSLFFPPLAVWYGYEAGARRAVVVWLVAVTAYALGVAVA